MTAATTQLLEPDNEQTNSQVEPTTKSKKNKITIYLTEEAEHAFTELYIARYRKNKKIDRSTIACEAIQALFEQEFGQN
jgi:hypothetical protein